MGLAARTAVVAGTASAVSNRAHQGQQAKAQQAADAEAYRQQQQAEAQAAAIQAPPSPPAGAPAAAAPAAAASGTDDVLSALERLAALHGQGILTDEELAQQKARILGA
jgi:hypothetical protein